jgi:hypothetical protein
MATSFAGIAPDISSSFSPLRYSWYVGSALTLAFSATDLSASMSTRTKCTFLYSGDLASVLRYGAMFFEDVDQPATNSTSTRSFSPAFLNTLAYSSSVWHVTIRLNAIILRALPARLRTAIFASTSYLYPIVAFRFSIRLSDQISPRTTPSRRARASWTSPGVSFSRDECVRPILRLERVRGYASPRGGKDKEKKIPLSSRSRESRRLNQP